jgi:hypothetical protein
VFPHRLGQRQASVLAARVVVVRLVWAGGLDTYIIKSHNKCTTEKKKKKKKKRKRHISTYHQGSNANQSNAKQAPTPAPAPAPTPTPPTNNNKLVLLIQLLLLGRGERGWGGESCWSGEAELHVGWLF